MYDYAVLHFHCSLALSTVNSQMPCASTEGQNIMKNAGKYLCSKRKPHGKKITPLFLHKL